MNKFLIMPENGKWFYIEVYSDKHEMAFSFISSDFSPNRRVGIVNCNTNILKVYTHQIDKNGNWIANIEHNLDD